MITLDLYKSLHAAEGCINLNVQLKIDEGQFLTIYGESGAGKTSIFRMLAGLMQPDGGQIIVRGKTWFDSRAKINRKPQERKVGFVFQNYALFPHMTIRQNIEFALGRNQNRKIVEELIELTELKGVEQRKPKTLSGGQKQRVALARALALQPDILLLDEPLSALDRKIRMKIQDYLEHVHEKYGLTTLLISHDISEIVKLSDRVCFLDKGRIIRQGTPDEIFMSKEISGKFRFTGEVLGIEKQGVVYIVTAMVQNNMVKIIAQEEEIKDISIGDKVMLISKAFNPILYKID